MLGRETASQAADCYAKNKALHFYQLDTKRAPVFLRPPSLHPKPTPNPKDAQSLKTTEATVTADPSAAAKPVQARQRPAGQSAASQQQRTGAKIEDRLMMQWLTSEQKKEALRRSEQLRRDPKISEYSKRMARVGSVHDR